jgi:murein tripeptide amidase MpaA
MPSGYLSVTAIEAALSAIVNTWPQISELITLPETSIEGRISHAIRIGKPSSQAKRELLIIAGAHARELVNPDAVVAFAAKLCHAYTNNLDIGFAGKTFDHGLVKLVVDSIDLVILPQVNPDGRAWVLNPSGYPMWRKNRRINANGTIGVDLNRNYDFVWSETIGSTSTNPASDTYSGASAFSEPETRNVRYLLESRPIHYLIDAHSYSQLVLYPWGDDESQFSDPNMNFHNPAFNGQRGTLGANYREFMPVADRDYYLDTSKRIRDAIQSVRGSTYTPEPGFSLYGTSGTAQDYAYSRAFANPSKRKVMAYTLESGTTFQPTGADIDAVINEVGAGVMQLCISSVCAVDVIAPVRSRGAFEQIRAFRDRAMAGSVFGRKYIAFVRQHSAEVIALVNEDKAAHKAVAGTLEVLMDLVASKDSKQAVVDAALVERVDATLALLSKRASVGLKRTLEVARKDLGAASGKEVTKLFPLRTLKPLLEKSMKRERK